MRVSLTASLTFGLLIGTVALPVAEPLPRPQTLKLSAPATRSIAGADHINLALAAAAQDRWSDAQSFARQTGVPVAADIILWTRLRTGGGEWAEYEDFLARNADWPGLASLRREGEHLMPVDLPPAEVAKYFTAQLPQSATGSMRLAEAFVAAGKPETAERVILRAWAEMPMSVPERAALQETWGHLIAERQMERLDWLLWNGYMREAETMLDEFDPGWQALAKARIATRRDTAGLQLLIQSVPRDLQDDPGLAFERYLYRVSKGRWDDAEEYLFEQSIAPERLGRPDFWMERRAGLARQALRRGEIDRAYRLAANSFGTEGGDYAEAEWLAGYIALTEMDDPNRAAEHFSRFRDVVQTPISSGRAGYWLGVALEKAGKPDQAAAAYRYGAEHQTSFYGQLAAERADLEPDASIAATPAPATLAESPVLTSSVVQAARLFMEAGQDGRAAQFLRHAAENQPADVRAALAQIAMDGGLTHVGVRVAKDAARERIILPDHYYPLPEMAEEDWPIPTELALAVARQESELNAGAASHAGAQGLMQLMPATARQMAEDLGLPYSASRLVHDPNYNATLGTAYLARMLKRYDGSTMLAAAAYNAGPGRVDEWLDTYGDPRAPGADPIIWIESIPFNETRNYVMRVLEGLHVYRARIEGQAGPIRLASDMLRMG
ncbi:transglycosylase SLT domain-containing protein [Amaricoccus macauensis]|uniref:lytic transglycosylase domain-containing protein n=1 Tax=Amaricoccus macauensis TaxID=57001 RepID=UPI003C7E0B9E